MTEYGQTLNASEARRLRRMKRTKDEARSRFVDELRELEARGYSRAALARAIDVPRQEITRFLGARDQHGGSEARKTSDDTKEG